MKTVASLFWIAVATSSVAADAAPAEQESIRFNRDVRPILSDNCWACHGRDARQRKAKLRLDVRERAVAEVIVPGKPDASPVVERIFSDDVEEVMPPAGHRKKLTARQKQILRDWIEQGARWQDHWAWIPPVRRDEDGTATIDDFVERKLQQHGLGFSKEADRHTLVRRLSFDLRGLPPSPAEVQAFVADPSPTIYQALVDRFLDSPAFGERMAVYWLDLVRYADTNGYHADIEWGVSPYRDYVIRAFNENLPFDQFTREQIAGDLIPNATIGQEVAAGFNRLNMKSTEFGIQDKEYLAKYAADRVRTTATTWLGVTLGCSECHDHKFDPFTIRDFYSLAAYFADIKGLGYYPDAQGKGWGETITVPSPEGERSMLATVSVKPRTMRVLPRGNWMDDTGEIVSPAIPASFGKAPGTTRLDLAAWITARDNPLTARVFVNRLWKQFFGTGLSRVLDDMGSQGEWPSHPELLDWLAVEFMDSAWDVKHMVRLMVNSRAYRQSSLIEPRLLEVDPDNRLLARQSRFRLTAEFIRDNALAVSGLLVRDIGGKSVKPYQPAGYWDNLNFPKRMYRADTGPAQYRRGLYTHWQRQFLHPALLVFDAPSREECTAHRPRSNTPLGALVLLNDPTHVEAARALAETTLADGDLKSETARIESMVMRVLARKARDIEVAELQSLLKKHRSDYASDPDGANRLLSVGQRPVALVIEKTELAAWTSVARALLNLHEAITRN